jgi:7-cyano-7-deazaguanine reductase
MKKYACTKLEVAGRFMRRGGIDINPVRSTHKKLFFNNFRFFNQ